MTHAEFEKWCEERAKQLAQDLCGVELFDEEIKCVEVALKEAAQMAPRDRILDEAELDSFAIEVDTWGREIINSNSQEQWANSINPQIAMLHILAGSIVRGKKFAQSVARQNLRLAIEGVWPTTDDMQAWLGRFTSARLTMPLPRNVSEWLLAELKKRMGEK
jgi:hypothetical protein